MPKPTLKTALTTAVAVVADTKPIDLAKLDGAKLPTVGNFNPDELGARAKAMIEHIDALDQERARKAILAGIYLHQVKLALGHGEFGAWQKRHFAQGHSTVQRVMALAEKFCRSAKLFLPELVASQQLSLDLQAPKGAAQAFLGKLTKFVGSHGLTELYRRHGIIKKGGAREKAAPTTTTDADADTTPVSLSPEALAYDQMVKAIDAAKAALLDEVRWSLLTPETAARVEPLLKKLESDFHNRLLQARHEAAA